MKREHTTPLAAKYREHKPSLSSYGWRKLSFPKASHKSESQGTISGEMNSAETAPDSEKFFLPS